MKRTPLTPNTPPHGIDPVLVPLLRSMAVSKINHKRILRVITSLGQIAPQPEIRRACAGVTADGLIALLGLDNTHMAKLARALRRAKAVQEQSHGQ